MATLKLKNDVQAALFKYEIRGQLSDGRWENASPSDHWRPWCCAKVVVDSKQQGRDFWVRKDSYSLTSSDLLEAIGDRILVLARVASRLGLARVDEIPSMGWYHDALTSDGRIDKNPSAKFGDDVLRELQNAHDASSVTMRDLKRELRDMKIAMKTAIAAYGAASMKF